MLQLLTPNDPSSFTLLTSLDAWQLEKVGARARLVLIESPATFGKVAPDAVEQVLAETGPEKALVLTHAVD